MIPVSSLNVGDQVRIVEEWTEECDDLTNELMNKWLGSVMTVREINSTNRNPYVKMEEDRSEWSEGWFWYEPMISCILESPLDEFKSCDSEDFSAFLQMPASAIS